MNRFQTIRFKYKGKLYTFSRVYNNPAVDQYTSYKWVHQCLKSVGVKSSKQVTCMEVTWTGWNFWAGLIA